MLARNISMIQLVSAAPFTHMPHTSIPTHSRLVKL